MAAEVDVVVAGGALPQARAGPAGARAEAAGARAEAGGTREEAGGTREEPAGPAGSRQGDRRRWTADGAFDVIRLSGPTARRRKAELLVGALAGRSPTGQLSRPAPGRPGGPGVAPEVQVALRRMFGSGNCAREVVDLTAGLAPDAVVVADYRHELAPAVLDALARKRRTSLLALARDDLVLDLEIYDQVLGAARRRQPDGYGHASWPPAGGRPSCSPPGAAVPPSAVPPSAVPRVAVPRVAVPGHPARALST